MSPKAKSSTRVTHKQSLVLVIGTKPHNESLCLTPNEMKTFILHWKAAKKIFWDKQIISELRSHTVCKPEKMLRNKNCPFLKPEESLR